ncbi:MAG: tRNA-intron lyase [Nanoarchaeota archaeon]|nr:tRNA-intron lyase [Nanoarchaeota archaeon]MBU1850190.1 tRNA-intron lyase [Nanoarchaeota archaeon]
MPKKTSTKTIINKKTKTAVKIVADKKTADKKKEKKAPNIIKKEESKKEKPKAFFARERVITEDNDSARELFNQSCYGKILDDGKVQLSLQEALYLMDKGKMLILDGRNKEMNFQGFLKRANKIEPNFWIRYCVFKDMRTRGYVVKTALKFGADFRVYDRGIKPGEDHARWIIYPVHEGSTLTWYEFAAKNRVAHSTKKRLMMGVVDDEGDVTYWEIKWLRP